MTYNEEQIGRGFALVLKHLSVDALRTLQNEIIDVVCDNEDFQRYTAEEVGQIKALHEAVVNAQK